jgi:predicted extracellular nuclease
MKKLWVILLIGICATNSYCQENEVKITDVSDIQAFLPDTSDSVMTGKEVSVRGIVTVPPKIYKDEIIYVQDKTGGVEVYCRNLPECKLGDEVIITGEVMEYNDETEIAYCKLQVVKSDKEVPEPKQIKASEVAEEKYEGLLVVVSGTVVKTPDGKTNKWFKIEDESGIAEVYVYEKAGIDLSAVTLGKKLSVTGVASQYKKSKQIKLRFQSDIKETAEEVKKETE